MENKQTAIVGLERQFKGNQGRREGSATKIRRQCVGIYVKVTIYLKLYRDTDKGNSNICP